MSVTIEIESPDFDLEQLRGLWQACWDECSQIKGETCAFHGQRGFLIQPDIEQYQRLMQDGAAIVLTAREEGRLCGFAIGIFYRALHHRLAKCGNVDSCYLEPSARAHIRGLVNRLESEFTARSVDIIAWPTIPDGSLYPLLSAWGYAPDDVVMEKKLCASPPQ